MTICVTFFIYKNPDTLRYAVFHGIFEIGGGGGGIFIKKIHFSLRFYIQKAIHFESHCYI